MSARIGAGGSLAQRQLIRIWWLIGIWACSFSLGVMRPHIHLISTVHGTLLIAAVVANSGNRSLDQNPGTLLDTNLEMRRRN